ncbi:hypothetical protein [Nitrosomonas sp.]|uniref:hypothetical protein n=1 Tax=Nitrosomonas sp. TaxID=42353 RepID=UPI001D923BA2|nr:hypothetical protein [Nitrosomonas sp.]MCB1950353.1 hypothetical protein [Nitrosomonas sp.]
MKNIQLISLVVCLLALVLLPGCSNDGDGKIETKEPKKELSELPERKDWFATPISQQPNEEWSE